MKCYNYWPKTTCSIAIIKIPFRYNWKATENNLDRRHCRGLILIKYNLHWGKFYSTAEADLQITMIFISCTAYMVNLPFLAENIRIDIFGGEQFSMILCGWIFGRVYFLRRPKTKKSYRIASEPSTLLERWLNLNSILHIPYMWLWRELGKKKTYKYSWNHYVKADDFVFESGCHDDGDLVPPIVYRQLSGESNYLSLGMT